MARQRHQLSPREIEVLTCICNGQTTDAAASALRISKRTVEDHLRHACAKLGASNRAHAVAIAVKRGLIAPDIGGHGAQSPDGENSSEG